MRLTSAPAPTSVSVSVVSGPMVARSPTVVAPSSWVPGRIVTSRTDGDVGVDPGGGGVDDRHALAHPALDDAAVELLAQPGQLDAVVDALGLPQVVDEVGADPCRRPCGRWRRTSVRYFSPWALSVPTWPSALDEHRGVEGVDAGVDLGDGALLVGGVLLLDDALDASRRSPRRMRP